MLFRLHSWVVTNGLCHALPVAQGSHGAYSPLLRSIPSVLAPFLPRLVFRKEGKALNPLAAFPLPLPKNLRVKMLVSPDFMVHNPTESQGHLKPPLQLLREVVSAPLLCCGVEKAPYLGLSLFIVSNSLHPCAY